MAPWNSQKKDTGSRQGAGTAGASSGSGKAAVLLSNPTFEGRKNDQGAGVCRPAGLGLVWVPSKGSGGQRRQRLAASAPLPSSSGCLRGVAWRTSGPVLVLGHFCTGATEYDYRVWTLPRGHPTAALQLQARQGCCVAHARPCTPSSHLRQQLGPIGSAPSVSAPCGSYITSSTSCW